MRVTQIIHKAQATHSHVHPQIDSILEIYKLSDFTVHGDDCENDLYVQKFCSSTPRRRIQWIASRDYNTESEEKLHMRGYL